MNLSKLDKYLLEYAVNEEPWHIVCGVFCCEYGTAEKLAKKLFALKEKGLVSISPELNTLIPPNIKALVDAASQEDNYEDVMVPNEFWWDIKATDKGFNIVRDRFK